MKATLKDNAKIEIHEVTLDWSDGTPKVIEDRVLEPLFKVDDRVIFNTHEANSTLNKYSGIKGTIIRPLKDREECDISEVGYMYKVLLDNGIEVEAFEDEIEKE